MVPNVAKAGSSFKGAFAYYLHDKREEGEQVRDSSDRVSWTETRNLMTDNPETASKIMAATALDQERLKREAGIKNTGRKSPNSVYAYSLAWHPDEAGKIDRAEMLRAADASLKAIGAHDRQAVIIAHNDEPHPHVHVVVNRVSMDDGRMMTTSNDFRKLDAWALAYRQERGEEQLYCPARAEKADAIKRKNEGQDVEFVRGEKSTPRSMEQEFSQAKAANQNEAMSVREQQKAYDAGLAAHSRSQAHRHKTEWKQSDERYRHKKAEIKDHAKEAAGRAREQIKEQYRPAWRDLYRTQYRERQFFDKREERLSGKVENALLAIAHRRQIDPDGSRGLMGHTFNFLTSKKARSEALDKLHKVEQRHLSKAQREEIGAAINTINSDKSALLSQARKSFNSERTALIERQAGEKKELQAKWKQRTAERRRAFDTIVKKADLKKSAKARPETQNQAKPDFKRAAEAKTRSRSRSRSRSRKIDDE